MLMPTARKHPDYGSWVATWGKMHADDENRAWLDRVAAHEPEIEEHGASRVLNSKETPCKPFDSYLP